MISGAETKKAIEWVEEIYSQGRDLDWFLDYFINYLRNLYFYALDPRWTRFAAFSEEDINLIRKRAGLISLSEIKKLINLFLKARKELKMSPIATLPIEIAIIEAVESLTKDE